MQTDSKQIMDTIAPPFHKLKASFVIPKKWGISTVKFNVDKSKTARDEWRNKSYYLLQLTGFVVSLGNMWNYVEKCRLHGGLLYTLMYPISQILFAFPLLVVEMSLGQYSSLGPVFSFSNIAPIFQGYGVSLILLSFIICIYFNVVNSWLIHYLMLTVTQSVFPWSSCHNEYNTIDCFSAFEKAKCDQRGGIYTPGIKKCHHNATKALNATFDSKYLTLYTYYANYCIIFMYSKVFSEAEYFYYGFLKISDGIQMFGSIRWEILLSVLLSWVLIYLCIMKGTKSSGMMSYITTITSLCIFFLLFIRSLFLSNEKKMLKEYMSFDLKKLFSIEVWKDTAIYSIYSLKLCTGTVITLSSFNRFKNNVLLDAALICSVDYVCNVVAAITVFCYLDYLSETAKLNFEEIDLHGFSVGFVGYLQSFSLLQTPKFFTAALLFAMVLFCLNTAFPLAQNVMIAITDDFDLMECHKEVASFLICCGGFLCSLPFVFENSVYIMMLLTHYLVKWSLLVGAFILFIITFWFYGTKCILHDLREMGAIRGFGTKTVKTVKIYFRFFYPSFLFIYFVLAIVSETSLHRVSKEAFPYYVDYLGWVLSLNHFLCVPVMAILAIHEYVKMKRSKKIRSKFFIWLQFVTSPTRQWRNKARIMSYKDADNSLYMYMINREGKFVRVLRNRESSEYESV